MELVVIALVIVIFGLLAVLDRQHSRAHEQSQAHRLEVAGLCQRIQAPQVAVVDHSQAQHASEGMTHAMTDRQAAEAEEAARVIAEMERVENEAFEMRQF